MRVSLIIKSHLNNAIVEMDYNPISARKHLRFAKYLVHMFPDTDTDINENVVLEQFKLGEQYYEH
jgi:hypothetical protein